MKIIVILILLTGANILNAQTTFVVDDFSDRYFGKVFIADINEVFSPGWIAIFDKKTKKELIKVTSEELTSSMRGEKMVSNIKELPYGEQSSIMYEDYNFDGKKDLAIMDGQNSCYHGPSFRVYLATTRGFKFSSDFTQLAQEYCGMFGVDQKAKTISTMTKSGCCWHQYSEYIVQNNKPLAIKVVEEGRSADGLTWDISEQKRINGKMVSSEYRLFEEDENDIPVIFSFAFRNKKVLRLVKYDDTLNYVFTDKDGKVELIYSGPFSYTKDENALAFTNGNTAYKISGSGVVVTSSKVNADMKAEPATIKGSLSELERVKFVNVTYQ